MRKGLIAILILLSALSVAQAHERLDSLSNALGTYWGSALDTSNLSEREKKELLHGMELILTQTPDSASRAAFMKGASLAMSIINGFDEMASLGMKADREQTFRVVLATLNGDKSTPTFTPEEASAYIDSRFREFTSSLYSPESQARFLSEAEGVEGAVTTPSGLVFRVITEGEGPLASEAYKAKVSYKGMLSDGTVFDVTDEPIVLDLGRVVPGLAEGVRMMKPGGVYDIVIPASLAYGEDGAGGGVIPPGAALRFVVELISAE
ncbi:MAG: FKBP-type peptidyl-prolyl cis-trans isomerase [Duncaniella sp.]|nr:FKBP-type peptidyl-prolyl cis-trans isomerase [Duncaniella sp.]